jgi:hypothetical protein
MKKLLIGLLTLGTISTHASMLEINGPLDGKFFEEEVSQGKSYFDTLGDMFSKGTRPEPTKLKDVLWAGRCFFASKPNEPTNTGYIFRETDSNSEDVGPIGNMNIYEARGFYKSRSAPNYYDTLTLEEAMKEMHLKFLKISITQTSLVSEDSNSFQVVKQSGKYLVLEVKEKLAVGYEASANISCRCYYFIPGLN